MGYLVSSAGQQQRAWVGVSLGMAVGPITPRMARPSDTEVTPSAAFPGSFQGDLCDIFLNLSKIGEV